MCFARVVAYISTDGILIVPFQLYYRWDGSQKNSPPPKWYYSSSIVHWHGLQTFKPPPLAPSLPQSCNTIRGPVAAHHENYRTCCSPYPYTSPDAHPTRYCSTGRCVRLPHLATFTPPPLAPSLPRWCNAIRGPVAARHENYRTCCRPYPYTSPDAHPTRYCSTSRCVGLPHWATFKPPFIPPIVRLRHPTPVPGPWRDYKFANGRGERAA